MHSFSIETATTASAKIAQSSHPRYYKIRNSNAVTVHPLWRFVLLDQPPKNISIGSHGRGHRSGTLQASLLLQYIAHEHDEKALDFLASISIAFKRSITWSKFNFSLPLSIDVTLRFGLSPCAHVKAGGTISNIIA